MRIIDKQGTCTSRWRHLADQEPAGDGDITVSVGRWLQHGQSLLTRRGRTGVRLQPQDSVEVLRDKLQQLDLIALEASGFAEGRGYTQAWLLRDRFGYRGEMRALGARRDHLYAMARCGIDAFELAPGEDLPAALKAFDEIRVRYQPAADGAPFLFQQLRVRISPQEAVSRLR